MRLESYLAVCAIAGASVASAQTVPLFAGGGGVGPYTFNSASNPGTAVTSAGDLGNPFGSFSFSGSAFGGIGGNRPSFAAAHNGSGSIANMTQMSENSVSFGDDFSSPVTRVADGGSGHLLFANFAQSGGFTNGESTAISFGLASFGNSNEFGFKYNFVRGLDSDGKEVFELLFVAGSGGGIRDVFVRGADDDSTTLTAAEPGPGETATPEGTKIVDSSQFAFNGTSVANGRPGAQWDVSIVLENGQAVITVLPGGGDFTPTALNGTAFDINSDATSIASLEFSSVWRDTVNDQNKGYWVDDIFAETVIPAPGGVSVLAVGGFVAMRRRR